MSDKKDHPGIHNRPKITQAPSSKKHIHIAGQPIRVVCTLKSSP
jgi:hypothetical protein